MQPTSLPKTGPMTPLSFPEIEKKASVRALFSSKLAVMTILIWFVYFFNLLAIYGLITWLPTLLHGAGLSLPQELWLHRDRPFRRLHRRHRPRRRARPLREKVGPCHCLRPSGGGFLAFRSGTGKPGGPLPPSAWESASLSLAASRPSMR